MTNELLIERAKALKLYGLLAHWDEVFTKDWVPDLLLWEEDERSGRSLANRLKCAHIGRFKPLAYFDWLWPKKCDREAIEEFMQLTFLEESINLVICGPNGVGKSTLARNIAHQAVIQGHTALFTTAGDMLNDLASQESDSSLRRKLKFYAQPELLIIDEVGYLSYSNRHADLMFEIISRRYDKKSTVVTTNKPFTEWREIFPNASCVVSLVDRLVHRSEIINIEAESYRLKEAKEDSVKRKEMRAKRKSSSGANKNGRHHDRYDAD